MLLASKQLAWAKMVGRAPEYKEIGLGAFGGSLHYTSRVPETAVSRGRALADFKTHITASTVLGITYGAAGFYLYGISLPHSVVAGTLCSVAGMLPDLDSDSGVPLRETMCFVAVLVPMLTLRRFYQFGWTPETMAFVAGVMYVAIRFGIGFLFKRFTKHRGMWHSFPAALIAGMITYLLCLSPEIGIRAFKAWAVVLGFVSHLFLDEIYSVDLNGKKIRIKKSSGTAMKFLGDNMIANVLAYGVLVGLGYLVLVDRGMIAEIQPENMSAGFQSIADALGRTAEFVNEAAQQQTSR